MLGKAEELEIRVKVWPLNNIAQIQNGGAKMGVLDTFRKSLSTEDDGYSAMARGRSCQGRQHEDRAAAHQELAGVANMSRGVAVKDGVWMVQRQHIASANLLQRRHVASANLV